MDDPRCQRVVVLAALSAFTVFLLACGWATPASAQEVSSKPVVIPPLAHDVSPPLRDIVASAPPEAPAAQRIIPLRATRPLPGAGAPQGEDPVLQRESLPLVGTTSGLNFAGISADGVAPPDTNGSVGNTQYVQIVNVEYAVYDKATGTLLLGPTSIHNIWSGFSGDCASGDGGDPNVLFDKAAARWVVGQINVNDNAYCIAVSTTSDATGSYYRYEYSFGNNLPDYPKLGVWPDAYYFAPDEEVGGEIVGIGPNAELRIIGQVIPEGIFVPVVAARRIRRCGDRYAVGIVIDVDLANDPARGGLVEKDVGIAPVAAGAVAAEPVPNVVDSRWAQQQVATRLVVNGVFDVDDLRVLRVADRAVRVGRGHAVGAD